MTVRAPSTRIMKALGEEENNESIQGPLRNITLKRQKKKQKEKKTLL